GVRVVPGDLYILGGPKSEIPAEAAPLRPTLRSRAPFRREVAGQIEGHVRRTAADAQSVGLGGGGPHPGAALETRHVVELLTSVGADVRTSTFVLVEASRVRLAVPGRPVETDRVHSQGDFGIPLGIAGKPLLGEDLNDSARRLGTVQ